MTHAYIYDAVRTPRGRGKESGPLYTVRPIDLLAQTLQALQRRTHLDTQAVDDIVMGCVTQTGEQGSCIARFAGLLAGYDECVSGMVLSRFCGSGLEAVNHASAMIMAGASELIVAGGIESMSRVKMGSDGGAMLDVSTQWKLPQVPQGISADLIATKFGFSRQDLDDFAYKSHMKATQAIERGLFSKSLFPVCGKNNNVLLDRDDCVRPDTALDRLAALSPSFEVMGKKFFLDCLTKERYPELDHINHVHTAGNSSAIADGACAILLGSKDQGPRLGIKPRARIRSMAVISSEPTIMLTGPVPATKRALEKAGMQMSDIDLLEVNEAFAVVPLYYAQELKVDLSRINVHGGAIALGHPLGATGAILLNTALDALEQLNKSTALITLCIGGGMGIATIIERM